jgi:hypothetical protein
MHVKHFVTVVVTNPASHHLLTLGLHAIASSTPQSFSSLQPCILAKKPVQQSFSALKANRIVLHE